MKFPIKYLKAIYLSTSIIFAGSIFGVIQIFIIYIGHVRQIDGDLILGMLIQNVAYGFAIALCILIIRACNKRNEGHYETHEAFVFIGFYLVISVVVLFGHVIANIIPLFVMLTRESSEVWLSIMFGPLVGLVMSVVKLGVGFYLLRRYGGGIT